MQTTKVVKRESKLRAWWRRLWRETPFWKKRLGDLTDGEVASPGPLSELGEWMGSIFGTIIVMVTGAIAVSALSMLVIGPIFLSPDFMTVGLADPIGRGLAAVCLATGRCDPAYLLAGAATGVLILLLLAYVVLYSIMRDDADDANVDDGELAAGLTALDERLVHLRADLVLANVLPLSKEEAEEIAGDFVENATLEQRAAFYDAAAKMLRKAANDD